MRPSARNIARHLASTTALFALASLAPSWAVADVVTGTVTPADAKVVIVNAAGETVAQPKAGPYQLQLPVGKYKAKCSAPKASEHDFLVLSEPVTVNVDCAK